MKQKATPIPALEACDLKRQLLTEAYQDFIDRSEGKVPPEGLMICSGKYKRFSKLYVSFKTSRL